MGTKRIFTKEETELMIKMYRNGETYSCISKIIKTKPSKISEHLRLLGYGKRPKNTLKHHEYLSASRKNSIDEKFFETINSESKAYWLGFLYADGYVCKKYDRDGHEKGGSIELCLKTDDKYHIQKFLDDIKSSAPIRHREITLNGNKYSAERTCVTSIKLVHDLIKHGCVENKSLILKAPTTVPKELLHHFIRGYFDGDGCVAFYPDRYSYTFSIIGTQDILNFIAYESKISSFDIRSFEHKNCFELKIYSKKEIGKFHNYIYKDKTIFLERKYQKSLSMMKWCNLRDE